MCVDETGINQNMIAQKGFYWRGKEIRQRSRPKGAIWIGSNYTVVEAINERGVLGMKVIEGPIDADMFAELMAEVGQYLGSEDEIKRNCH